MTDEVSHQPAIPTLEIPDYHGRKPVGMRTTLAGAGTRVTCPHTIGDRVVLVIEARVKSAAHDDTDDGLVYVEKLKVLDLFELDGDHGSRLLSTVRSIYRTGEDAVKGKKAIDGLGEAGWTDASGIALTPAEVAEIRGDPVRAILSPDLTPAVIVYDDGTRDLWPDEYVKDTPRPVLGQTINVDGRISRVVDMLHHETGESLIVTAEIADAEPAPLHPMDRAIADGAPPIPCSCGALSGLIGGLPYVDDEGIRHTPTDCAPATIPEPDPYSGDLGDDASADWETPDPATERRLADADHLPRVDDFRFVQEPLATLRQRIGDVDDLDRARRLLLAERQGRGTGAQPRKAAVALLEAHVTRLENRTS